MKRYITLFSIVALFFMGMQVSMAQNAQNQRPEAIAKQKTYEMHQLVNLSGDQQSAVFKALVDAEQNMGALNEKKDVKSAGKLKDQVVNNLNEKLKSILTPEQYRTYMSSLEKEPKK